LSKNLSLYQIITSAIRGTDLLFPERESILRILMKERGSKERGSSSGGGAPTATGRMFIEYCDKYRAANPNTSGIPLSVQDNFWEAAATATQNQRFLDNLQDVRVARFKNIVRRLGGTIQEG